jgi:hypothetical protein
VARHWKNVSPGRFPLTPDLFSTQNHRKTRIQMGNFYSLRVHNLRSTTKVENFPKYGYRQGWNVPYQHHRTKRFGESHRPCQDQFQRLRKWPVMMDCVWMLI